MNFKIGQIVSVVDEDIEGKIIHLTAYKVTIEIDDFFERVFMINKISSKSEKKNYEKTLDKIPLNIHKPKIKSKTKQHISRKTKEIDLHFDELSESKKGMTNHDMVLYQLKAVEKALRNTDKRFYNKIVFIHGVGKGKLRYELEKLLRRKKIKFHDASFKKYGNGALEILL